jgi:hypothetical protein
MGTGVASASAFVIRDRGVVECSADAGDIPGLPGFPISNSTIVFTPTGAIRVSCFGTLPAGILLSETFSGDVTCLGDDGTVGGGHIVATKSGRVSYTCMIPPPPQ